MLTLLQLLPLKYESRSHHFVDRRFVLIKIMMAAEILIETFHYVYSFKFTLNVLRSNSSFTNTVFVSNICHDNNNYCF